MKHSSAPSTGATAGGTRFGCLDVVLLVVVLRSACALTAGPAPETAGAPTAAPALTKRVQAGSAARDPAAVTAAGAADSEPDAETVAAARAREVVERLAALEQAVSDGTTPVAATGVTGGAAPAAEVTPAGRVDAALRNLRPALARCIGEHGGTLDGVRALFVVDERGRVAGARLEGGVPAPGLRSCAVARLKTMRIADWSAGEFRVNTLLVSDD